MADRAVGELELAELINSNDLFLLEQNGNAKALTGLLLTQFIDRNVLNVQIHTLEADQEAYGVFNKGTGILQLYVPRGSGIRAIEKTGTSDLVDTYTVTYERGASTTFTVTNGSSIYSVSKSESNGLADTYVIVLTNGNRHEFTVTNGRGITRVEAISAAHTPGTSDQYRFHFNDGTYTDIPVYNGKDGSGAVDSVNGKTGAVTLEASDLASVQGNSGNGLAGDIIALRNADSTLSTKLTALTTKVNASCLAFANKVVAVADWSADATYADYPYRATVICADITADYFAQVVFNVEDLLSGNYAPIATTMAGGVYIYAAEIPEATVTIPTIICWKASNV